MKSDKLWYAVYTRSRWEKKVSDLFNKKGIENFCPLNRVTRQWADRKKTVYEPLFTCYVFVCVTEQEQLIIKQTDGVLNFVHWLGKPAVIRHEEIIAIRSFLDQHDDVKLEKIDVNINDKVRIISGPLVHCEGEVLQINNNSIKVHLPSLGYAIVAQVKVGNVEIIKNAPGNATNYYTSSRIG